MVKQENSKTNIKFNKVSTFLSKFIFNNNFDTLKKIGYVDSYIQDPTVSSILIPEEGQRLLFLLFKNKKVSIEEMKTVVGSMMEIKADVLLGYELINDYSMVVLQYPQEFIKDYDLIVEGRYSKLSPKFKAGFPEKKDVLDDQKRRMGAEYSLYFHIFNRTKWIQDFWMERLGLVELDPALELWDKPTQEDLVFNINNILTN